MQVSVTITTKPQKFPGGTIGGNWRIQACLASDPTVVDAEYIGPNPNATFDLPEGEAYELKGVRLDAADMMIGPIVSTPYTVGEDLVTIDVALGITASSVASAAVAGGKGKK